MSRKFVFIVEATITMCIEVTADSLESAIKLAKDSPVVDLCHRCTKNKHDEWSPTGGLDCDPTDSTLTDMFVDNSEPEPGEFEAAQEKWA